MRRRDFALSTGRAARTGRLRGAVLLSGLVGVLLLSPPEVTAQSVGLSLDVEAVTLLSSRAEQPRLEIYVRVPYQGLRFVRRGGSFENSYAVSASVYRAGRGDRPSGLVMTRTWDRRITAPNFSETQAEVNADHSSHTVELPPGRYVLQMRLEDGVSARSTTQERVVEVPSLAGPVAMSDLVLADDFDRSARSLSPIVGGAVPSDLETFTLYFEVYSQQAERLRARYAVEQLGPERRVGGLAGLFGRREQQTTRVLEDVDWMTAAAGRSPASRIFETERFDAGDYQVSVTLERADGTILAERTRPFTIRWTGLIDQLQDLDVAIAQLRYIAKPNEIRAMREARTLTERIQLFREFWDKRDPSPGSHRNERMEEYYYRVAHASRHYGRLDGAGWETDQGEVFIRFGEPDRVENRPGDGSGRSYEVWHYERIDRRFIFVDESGRGDFRLLAPRFDERSRW